MSAYKSAVYCEHANECPSGPCRCDADCACREHMCRPAKAVKPRVASDFANNYARVARLLAPVGGKAVSVSNPNGSFRVTLTLPGSHCVRMSSKRGLKGPEAAESVMRAALFEAMKYAVAVRAKLGTALDEVKP